MRRVNGTTGSFPLDRGDVTGPVGEYRNTATVLAAPLLEDTVIMTPEGEMVARAGDFLAQHEDGHARPIKRATFEGTYEVFS